jgi:hypothetical protein
MFRLDQSDHEPISLLCFDEGCRPADTGLDGSEVAALREEIAAAIDAVYLI